MNRLSKCLIVATAILFAVPAFAADRTMYNGIDLWHTFGNGKTFSDFSKSPIPPGFFCYKSEPFTGRIVFKGVPVATNVSGALGGADTIVQRLDDATFNAKGIAATRLQVRSLNFESVAPIQTACGQFTARVSLDGEQPVTRMRIIRENAEGGRFQAPIFVNVKISFTPVGRQIAEPLEIRKSLRFPPLPNQRWHDQTVPQGKSQGFLLVDTDGDRVPDTYLPGVSNFGVGPKHPASKVALCDVSPDCHYYDNCQHCVCGYN
jgi:hypothetical protein